MKEGAIALYKLKDQSWDRNFAKSGVLVEIANEFAAEDPKIGCVPSDGGAREARLDQVSKEGPEDLDDVVARYNVLFKAAPTTRPVVKVGAVCQQIRWTSGVGYGRGVCLGR